MSGGLRSFDILKRHGRYGDAWTTTIVDEINSGIYKDLVPDWLGCTDVNDAFNCALQWAQDSNSLICSYVLKTNPEGKELSGTYYRGAASIVQEQVAKGWRSGSTSSSGLARPEDSHSPETDLSFRAGLFNSLLK